MNVRYVLSYKFVLFLGILFFVTSSYADLSTGLVAHYPMDLSAHDVSGNGHHGVSVGTHGTDDRNGNINGAIALNGTSDYIQIAHSAEFNPGAQGFSINMFVMSNSDQFTGDGVYAIMDKSHGFNCLLNASGWTIQGHVDYGVGFVIGNGIGFPGVEVPSLLDNQWHQISVVYDGSNVNFYVDGVLGSTQAYDGTPLGNDGDLYIGKWWCGGNRFFHGSVDEVRIYNRTLTYTEILELGGVPNEEPEPKPEPEETSIVDLDVSKMEINLDTGEVKLKGLIDPSNPVLMELINNPKARIRIELQTGEDESGPKYGVTLQGSVPLETEDSGNELEFEKEFEDDGSMPVRYKKHRRHHKHSKKHHKHLAEDDFI